MPGSVPTVATDDDNSGFRALEEDIVYDGWIMKVAVGRFEAPDGSVFERDVVHHPGAVAVVPLVDDDIILVRQYRSALDANLLEIPAGLRDVGGEPPAETARRELIEEIGMEPGTLTPLAAIHNSAGYSDEQIHIFIGTDLIEVAREMTDSPEEHAMEILRIPLTEAHNMIATGELTDAKTIIGVLAALRL